jgi:nicotinate-nucleotide pyrophosphorylase (carboxylating)
VPEWTLASGRITSKDTGILAGVELAAAAFRHLDADCRFARRMADGARIAPGDVCLEVSGKARGLLSAERVALNFLQRLSGIATLTAAFVERLRSTGCVVLETRKTTPGLRALEKYAVRVGGGENHRSGLFDMVLLKSNHFALSGEGVGAEGYRRTVEKALRAAPGLRPVAAEARSIAEMEGVIRGGADIVLLDNMDVAPLKVAVETAREVARQEGRTVLLEASGGIRLENAFEVAATGVDRISVGALTHSFRSLDLSMTLEQA